MNPVADVTNQRTSKAQIDVDGPEEWHNSTLLERQDLTEDLAVFRVKPDGKLFSFRAGQYTVIGLPASAPRYASAEPEEKPNQNAGKLIRRAYSIASSSKISDYLELYVTLVRSGELTPRLWLLRPDDRLWLGPRAKGHFTMAEVPPDKNVILIGTGTGLAPYIAMIQDHHRCNRGRRFIVVHGARHVRELGYRDELEALARECSTMVYVPTVSRPATEDAWLGHVGRVQSVFADGTVEGTLRETLSPESTHVFLSGNPERVEHMQRLFLQLGYSLHSARTAGSLHVERYW